MRVVCEYAAALPRSATASSAVTFVDKSFAERIGWREIVYGTDQAGVSQRLTNYPQDLLTQPLDVTSIQVPLSSIEASAAGWLPPDAQPLSNISGGAGVTPAQGGAAAVPGGIGGELSAMIDARDLSPLVVLAVDADRDGPWCGACAFAGPRQDDHGRLSGRHRGTARHALALGMTVTVSHTLGVLTLALVTLLASSAIPPERLYPVLGVGSGVTVVDHRRVASLQPAARCPRLVGSTPPRTPTVTSTPTTTTTGIRMDPSRANRCHGAAFSRSVCRAA
jgi:hypothetical protein